MPVLCSSFIGCQWSACYLAPGCLRPGQQNSLTVGCCHIWKRRGFWADCLRACWKPRPFSKRYFGLRRKMPRRYWRELTLHGRLSSCFLTDGDWPPFLWQRGLRVKLGVEICFHTRRNTLKKYNKMMLNRILFCLVCCQFWAYWPKKKKTETGQSNCATSVHNLNLL